MGISGTGLQGSGNSNPPTPEKSGNTNSPNPDSGSVAVTPDPVAKKPRRNSRLQGIVKEHKNQVAVKSDLKILEDEVKASDATINGLNKQMESHFTDALHATQ